MENEEGSVSPVCCQSPGVPSVPAMTISLTWAEGDG